MKNSPNKRMFDEKITSFCTFNGDVSNYNL